MPSSIYICKHDTYIIEYEIKQWNDFKIIFTRDGRSTNKSDTIIADETNSIKPQLWEDKIDQVSAGKSLPL